VIDDSAETAVESSSESAEQEQNTSTAKNPDDDEVIVEEVADGSSKTDETVVTPKMKKVVVDEWIHLNPQPPLWMRCVALLPTQYDFLTRIPSDPKNVSKEEYSLFYQTTFKDFKEPLTWSHFALTTESGVAFRAILYVPSALGESFWHQSADHSTSVRLMVKHVLIMSDLGEDSLPKWASWVKVIVDGASVLAVSSSRS
jgi:heat shock protein beta